MNAAEAILDRNISHQIFLQRFSSQTVRKIIALLDKADAKIIERLLREDDISDLTKARLDALLERMRKINYDAQLLLRNEMRSEIRGLATYEAGFQIDLLRKSIPVLVDYVTPSSAQLYAAVNAKPFQGRFLKDWFTDLNANSFKRLRNAVRIGFTDGSTTAEIVRNIRGTRANGFRDGILNTTRRGTEAMVRTALNHTANVAKSVTYQENSDVIKGVKWVATLDGRTSPICRSLDNQVFPVDKGPRPPTHINCRSTTTPVLKSWKEMGINLREAPTGTRSSLNGQVPSDLSYDEWLKKQSNGFQDEILGKTRGKLFRKGDFTSKRFVDNSGQYYNLDELRRKDAAAFERAGLD